jgi:hypothetical protein
MEFKTKTKLYEYVNSHINRIRECDSLKAQEEDFFNFCINLFKKHPGYPDKTRDLVDIKITRNSLNKMCYQLNVIRKDGSIEDISYRQCIYTQKNNHLNEAFRVAVTPDIMEFKNTHDHICSNKHCTSDNYTTYDVDHVNYFEKLVYDFMKDRTIFPTEFSETIHNQRCFKSSDFNFEQEWIFFHRKHAVLQILCHTCNLKRKKWSKKDS